MKKVILRHGLLAGVAIFTLAAAVPVVTVAQPVRAQEARTQAQERREAARQTTQTQLESPETDDQRSQDAQSRVEERREARQARLEAAQLKACEKREKAITNIMARISNRGSRQLEVFTKISDRTQAFYADKGNTLSNYEELVGEVTAKKEAAQTAVAAVTEASDDFTCDGDNPKAVADSFKANKKAMNAALKEYKTAVKDLIVGVKSVQSTTKPEGTTEGSEE